MAKIVAVTGCPTGIAHTIMAAEALKKTAKAMGHDIKVETQGAEGARDVLSEKDINEADVVIISSDIHVDMSRFAGKNVYGATTSEAIRYTQGVIESALDEAEEEAPPPIAEAVGPPKVEATAEKKYIIAITSCPTGIAHTFMAAEGVKSGAESLGHEVKVETQGSVGSQNTLTPEDIERADILLIAADTKIDKSRFIGKRIYETSTKAAIHDGAKTVETALAEAKVHGAAGKADLAGEVEALKKQRSASRTGPYKHLMTGVSYMLPFVVAGGLLIALAFAFGGIYVYENENTFGWALFQIGAPSAFALMVPILSGFIAYSIADRPGIAPGMIGGMLASSIGAGFLGGIVSGFIAGYFTAWLSGVLKLPRGLEGLKPILILPLLGSAVTGLLMIYVVGTPVKYALDALTAWLSGMQESSAMILGLILGAMMAFDMGGPVNKSAYAFSVGLLDSDIFLPMAAVMAAGMTPPLGLALASTLFKDRFSAEEREAGKAAWVLGAAFITEGAIPFAAKDPFRVIPSIMVGSAVTGALSMLFGCTLRVPHGGIFVLPIPNAVSNLPMYIVAILIGTLVTAAMLFLLKKPVSQPSSRPVAVSTTEATA
ncbi:MAG: PTS fructose-like transporter subunit IIB [Anaerolineae bacterium]|nr:PTS fructose-like transporter subunit IIB [Anaerolineae bacterium]